MEQRVFYEPSSGNSSYFDKDLDAPLNHPEYDDPDMDGIGDDSIGTTNKSNKLSSSSASLSNLPSIREAKQTFLYYLCRHGPPLCSYINGSNQGQNNGSYQGQNDPNSNNNTDLSSTNATIDGIKMLYRNILLQNVQRDENCLTVELQGLVDADNAHQRSADHNRRESIQTPFKPGEGPSSSEQPSVADELNRLGLKMAQGALGRLYVALRRRPLWYIRDLESVCQNLIKQEYALSSMTKDHVVKPIQLLLEGHGTRNLEIRELTVRYQEQFIVTRGIIIQAAVPHPKLSRVVLQCRYCDHRHIVDVSSTKDKFVLPRTCIYAMTVQQRNRDGGRAAPTEEGLDNSAQETLGCFSAKDPYIVLTNESTFVDVQTLKLQENPKAVPVGDVPRSVILNASGYNCGLLRPGERVIVHGALSNYNPQGDVYDGQNVPYIQVLRYTRMSTDQATDITFGVAERINFSRMGSRPDIHEKIFKSIAPALFGMDDVKKAIACVLFGGVQKEHTDKNLHRGDINMLMLGDPGVAKSQILKFASRAATISVYTSGKGSSAAGLTASVIRDRHGVFALEGGAMVLADGGVVCIDEFDKMRDEDIVAMHEAMEQQTISINKAGISTMLNSRCAVIAAANPTFGSYDDTQDSTEQHEMKATILSRFDVIFMLRDKEDYEKDSALCKHILNLQEGGHKQATDGDIPLETLRRYICYAKQNCSPALSPSAAEKLRTFYVKTRSNARSDKRSSTKKIPITIRQLESLYRLAESFARMQLSSEATEAHVDMAIEVFNASTVETAKHTLVFESMTPAEQKVIQQAEESILSRLQPGQRIARGNLLKEFQHQGYDRIMISRAIAILIKKGTLQERADRSIRRI